MSPNITQMFEITGRSGISTNPLLTIEADTNKKTNVSGTPKGVFGWLIMKLRFYNLLPNFQLSKFLPKFILDFLFLSVYSKPEKLDTKLIKKLTGRIEEIEENIKERENEIDDIFRILDAT